jgi:predicted phosphodiesterase
MIRRAIISDIHANLPALEAVLADIATQHVDELVCLGDICGYGPQPIECIQRMRGMAKWILLGNHDEAIYKEPIDFSPNARVAVVWQRTLLDPRAVPGPESEERWTWLQSLQPQRREQNVLYVHASPRDPIHEYVLKEDFDPSCGGPTLIGKAIFDAVDWLCFCGHSHRPGVVAEDYRWWLPEELEHGRSILRLGFKTIVNVGSVGQPRDGHPEACYALFDFDPKAGRAVEESKTEALQAVGDLGMTQILPRRSAAASSGQNPAVPQHDDETRTERDGELQRARTTLLLRSPKVSFRRVPYDVAEAQRRFFDVKELPQYNGVRLGRGI